MSTRAVSVTVTAALAAGLAAVLPAAPAAACQLAAPRPTLTPARVLPGQATRVELQAYEGWSYRLIAIEAGSTAAPVLLAEGDASATRTVAVDHTPRTGARTTFVVSGGPAPTVHTPGTVDCTGAPVISGVAVLEVDRLLGRLAASRTGTRSYVFSGRVAPARAGQLVSLYRVDGGREVLTAQTRTTADGGYRISRQFTGSGRFGFLTRVRADASNGAAASAVRPTVVH